MGETLRVGIAGLGVVGAAAFRLLERQAGRWRRDPAAASASPPARCATAAKSAKSISHP